MGPGAFALGEPGLGQPSAGRADALVHLSGERLCSCRGGRCDGLADAAAPVRLAGCGGGLSLPGAGLWRGGGAYNAIKYEVLRPRPFVALGAELRVSADEVQAIRPNSSFPSGHAANAFMLATLLAALLRRGLWPLWYGLALLVALSRVYLGLHYPGDVLAGAVLGSVLTWLLLHLPWLAPRLKMAVAGR